MKDIQEILAIACSVGWGAADILQSYYHGTVKDFDLEVEYKQNEPVTVADVAVSQYILEKLQGSLGNEDFGYISEETYKDEAALSQELVWIIDPLDGTRDFIQKTGEYAIHIALVKEKRPILAVVAVPEAEKLYYAIKGGGAFVETRQGQSQKIQVSSPENIEDLTVVVSRSHRNQRLDYLLEKLPFANQKAVGSVGCKIATIVEQNADVYISLSGKSAPKDWDIAAPELILTEAGGKYTHFDGTPLQYNTGDINQWGGLLASNGQFHEELCQEAEAILAEFDKLKI
ncbi:3'(2'),5'-bisphosphate nucleotidase CysQ [Scytonema hofmannii FACHB-248]|uniref:inositol-phosphate phosphatase n=1 Tax=Scytonema hofmannii FACHB-248 TaxID=1842502 RepID=A0ABR8GK36_9CYAN|nr:MULTISPECIES: 3'(2'),5'-bisphosphate nucleotidase CysQ [Nostocales]MBD2603518.1 3'(2'),5'-bisphosphate nucleotidase CysQ [Scytonema hofmannii FACHB-248]